MSDESKGNNPTTAGKITGWVIVGILGAMVVAWLGFLYGDFVAHFVRANPIAASLGSILLGVAIAWRFRLPQWWQSDRDIAVTVSVLSAGLAFGLYLITAASGFAVAGSQNMVVATAMGWALV
jgi:hypothetical protein